ncbi:MAG: creatininase family protein [Alphaproteobacteria bacterium]|nr:creatininase family protein [Alphaproteobacteria bacterium]
MTRLLLLLAVFITFAAPARAELFLENMTWTELRDAIAAGKDTVLVPIGGTEQSGPHLALGKHNARVAVLSGLIAEKLGRALVAPVMAYVPEGNIDPPTQHMKFPGTLSLTDATFIQVLEQAGRSLRHAGFAHVVFLGDHGGYQKDLTIAAAALNKEWAGKGQALGLTEYYALAQGPYVDALHAAGYADNEIGTHAALADTSLELATVPAMVRQAKLADPAAANPANGVYGGSPARANAAVGQKGVDLIVAGTVTAITQALAAK